MKQPASQAIWVSFNLLLCIFFFRVQTVMLLLTVLIKEIKFSNIKYRKGPIS